MTSTSQDLYSFTPEQIERIWDLDFSWDAWLQDDPGYNPLNLDIRLDDIYYIALKVLENDDTYLDEYLPEVENNLVVI